MRRPDKAHYDNVKYLGNWLATQMKGMYPTIATGFINIRCPLPDFTILFPSAQGLYTLDDCNLPPTLAVYSVCNALRMHSLTPETFLHYTFQPTEPAHVDMLLRVTRDVLMLWTMCRVEGRYYPDTCLGKECDDQPFVMVDMPGENVIPKEDCEGKTQVAVHMKQLFIAMYVDATWNNKAGLLKHWEQYPPHTGCLGFSEEGPVLQWLVEVCLCIGRHLYEERLVLHMVVGDVYFKPDVAEGHSFCALLYNDPETKLQKGIIAEATAWDSTVCDQVAWCDLPQCARAAGRDLMRAIQTALHEDLDAAGRNLLVGDTKQPNDIYVCSLYTPERRYETYSKIFCCDGCLLFSSAKCKTNRPLLPEYGINSKDLSSLLPLVDENTKEAPTQPFRIPTRSFIMALRDGQHGFPRVPDAQDMLKIYDRYCAEIADYASCYRPPPLEEHKIMERMLAWQQLGESDVIQEQTHDPFTHLHRMAFCWVASNPLPLALEEAVAAATNAGILTESACMYSRVFTFITAERGAKAIPVRF